MAVIPHFFDAEYWSPRMTICPMFGRDMQKKTHAMDHALRRMEHAAGSHIIMDKDKFQIALDVHQFAPSELNIVVRGKKIVVEGKHDEKEDEHGHVSRHFVRKFTLPESHHPDEVVSNLSSDGILTITAPRRPALAEGERAVPIQAVGPVIKPLKEDDAKTL